MKRLKANEYEVIENLADQLMRLRRSKDGLGLCSRSECVDKFKKSKHYQAGQGMMTPNTTNQPSKCGRCTTVIEGFEDSFYCMYCKECYCPPCLGYSKYYDLGELDALIHM
jgi:hypothetical protein